MIKEAYEAGMEEALEKLSGEKEKKNKARASALLYALGAPLGAVHTGTSVRGGTSEGIGAGAAGALLGVGAGALGALPGALYRHKVLSKYNKLPWLLKKISKKPAMHAEKHLQRARTLSSAGAILGRGAMGYRIGKGVADVDSKHK